MAKKNRNTFMKRQKELDRMQKAKEKMEKRQSKKNKTEEQLDNDIPPPVMEF